MLDFADSPMGGLPQLGGVNEGVGRGKVEGAGRGDGVVTGFGL